MRLHECIRPWTLYLGAAVNVPFPGPRETRRTSTRTSRIYFSAKPLGYSGPRIFNRSSCESLPTVHATITPLHLIVGVSQTAGTSWRSQTSDRVEHQRKLLMARYGYARLLCARVAHYTARFPWKPRAFNGTVYLFPRFSRAHVLRATFRNGCSAFSLLSLLLLSSLLFFSSPNIILTTPFVQLACYHNKLYPLPGTDNAPEGPGPIVTVSSI